MNHDQEDGEHAPDHYQPPWHLMRALVFLAHGAELGLRENAETDEQDGQAQADDPVENDDGSGSASRG